LAGETSVGADGAAMIVVKLHTLDQLLVAAAFVLLTRQKYCVLLESPVTVYDVSVIPLWSTTVAEKVELVETCNRYNVALLETFQLKVGLVDIPVEPFEGDASVGTLGRPNGSGIEM